MYSYKRNSCNIELEDGKFIKGDYIVPSNDLYVTLHDFLEENIRKTLKNVYKETRGHIEVVNIATPMTYERYCGAYKGSWMPFVVNPETKDLIHNGKLKGITNFCRLTHFNNYKMEPYFKCRRLKVVSKHTSFLK